MCTGQSLFQSRGTRATTVEVRRQADLKAVTSSRTPYVAGETANVGEISGKARGEVALTLLRGSDRTVLIGYGEKNQQYVCFAFPRSLVFAAPQERRPVVPSRALMKPAGDGYGPFGP